MSVAQPSAAGGRTPIDQAERDLAVGDVTRSYCVEAGAGTGKTSVLVGRLLTLIAGGHARLSEIAAITFTEKAAAELRLRLRLELERRGLADALAELDQAAISTIHAFAAALLRERPVEAGVDPGFEPIDELEDSLLFDECWSRWLASELAGAAPPGGPDGPGAATPPSAAAAATRVGAVALVRALRLGLSLEQVRRVARTLAAHPDLRPGEAAPSPPIDAFVDSLRRAARELTDLAGDCVDQGDAGYAEVRRVIAAASRVAGLDRDRREEFLLREFAVAVKGNKQKWRPRESCDRQKAICQELREEHGALAAAIRAHVVYELVAWLGEFVVALGREREARGVLNFTDLLVKARDMLLGHREARGYFQRRFKYVLIDEFQDTDPLQVEIAFLLAEAEPRAERWDEAQIVPGKLFIVGDPKQSIYRFRRADIETYDAARNRLVQCGGRLLSIRQNFRTVPEVVDWANRVFGELIRRPDDGNYQPDYEPLHTFREGLGRPSVILLGPPRPDTDGQADMRAGEVRALEAATISALVARIVEEGWPVVDRQSGTLRPATYGDVALLFPQRTGLDLFEDALRARGIPYRTEGGRQFFQRQETVSLLQLLTAVDNPYDAVAVVAALRSSLFACSDQALFEWRRAGGTFCYLDPAPVADPAEPAAPDPGEVAAGARPAGVAAVAEAMATLARLHGLRNTATIAEVVDAALAETRAMEIALLEGDARAAANLMKLVEQARALGEARGMVFRRFVRWLAERYREETDEADSPALEPDARAVQLLTVHKSKGLEFPIVILANANSARRNSETFLVDRQRGTFELRIGDQESGFASAGYEAALPKEQRRQVAEDRRLFYVAATRARDYLIIPEFCAEQRKGFLLYLQEAAVEGTFRYPSETLDVGGGAAGPEDGARTATGGGGRTAGGAPAVTSGGAPDAAAAYEAARGRWEEARTAALAAARAGLALRTPSSLHAAADGSGGWDDDAWADAPGPGVDAEERGHLPGAGAPVPPVLGARSAASEATAFGSALHAAMERLDLARTRPGDAAAIGEVARAAAMREGVGPRAEELAHLIAATLRLPPLQRARSARRVQREVPFCVPTDDGLMEGRIDLLVEDDAGFLVVDFKTDRVDGAALDERFEAYRPQGEAYARAVAAVAGAAVAAPAAPAVPVEVAFVFVRAGVVRTL